MSSWSLPFQVLFEMAMKRTLPDLVPPEYTADVTQAALWLNLGAGNNHIPGSISLDLPAWNAERDQIPYKDGSVDAITAFHFFEHLSGANAIMVLRECQRVLKVGGILTMCVPHRLGALAYQDLDHKSFWMEETLRTLFINSDYDKHRETPWLFGIRFNLICGVVERNLALITQLERIE